MPKLKKYEVLGADVYVTENMPLTRGYAQNTYAAPFIHAYNNFELALFTPMVLERGQPDYMEYKVRRFLVVQDLHQATTGKDVTIKPHRAISLDNTLVSVYNYICGISLYLNEKLIYLGKQSVYIHAQTLSPQVEAQGVAQAILDLSSDVLTTSYVIDVHNKQILITEHCLLLPANMDCISKRLEEEPEPSTEMLMGINPALSAGLDRFIAQDFNIDKKRIQQMATELNLYPAWINPLIKSLQSKLNELNLLTGFDNKKDAVFKIITSLQVFMDSGEENSHQLCIDVIKDNLEALTEHRNTLHGFVCSFFRIGNDVNFFSTKSHKLASVALKAVEADAPKRFSL